MDYRLDEPFNPDNEDAPEVERVVCSQCDGVIPADGVYWTQDGQDFCEDCFLPKPDPFDDVDFDGSRE